MLSFLSYKEQSHVSQISKHYLRLFKNRNSITEHCFLFIYSLVAKKYKGHVSAGQAFCDWAE